MGNDDQKQSTAELLAIKFPGVPYNWLKEVSKMLKIFGQKADMTVNWRQASETPRTQWTIYQGGIQEMSPTKD